MTKTFTQNDLIRFIYHETTETEQREIYKALICDIELQKQFNELKAVHAQLNAAHLEPSENVVNNILHYAQGMQEKH